MSSENKDISTQVSTHVVSTRETQEDLVLIPRKALNALLKYSVHDYYGEDILTYLWKAGADEMKVFLKYNLLRPEVEASILESALCDPENNMDLIKLFFWRVSKKSINRIFCYEAAHGNLETTKFIWEYGGEVNLSEALFQLCEETYITESHMEILRYLWFEGADIHSKCGNALQRLTRDKKYFENRKPLIDFLLEQTGKYECLNPEYRKKYEI